MSAEPTAGFAARVAAAIFAGEALILLMVALLFRSDLGDGRLVIPTASAGIGLLLFLFSERLGWRLIQAAVAVGTLLVSIHAWTAHNEPDLSGKMLYIWLGLYSAYFFGPRIAAAPSR